ncbi:MAG: carbohydrate binding domain-containing protein [Verrucomicrobia bacterium]|nr:carbohydrate binding domain-containing protein [Verrucomicrobiota bacterium]
MRVPDLVVRSVFLICLVPAAAGFAQEVVPDPALFQLEVQRGAQARLERVVEEASGAKVAAVTVSKPGPLFWSVELRVPALKFQAGKRYRCAFRAKSSSREYVYVVPEKATGNQASLVQGTNVALGDQWKTYTVEFTPSENADPARLTFSDLSVDQSTFWFAELKLTEE